MCCFAVWLIPAQIMCKRLPATEKKLVFISPDAKLDDLRSFCADCDCNEYHLAAGKISSRLRHLRPTENILTSIIFGYTKTYKCLCY